MIYRALANFIRWQWLLLGAMHARSDVDFCFEESPEMERFLELSGWRPIYHFEGYQQERSYWRNDRQHVDVILVRSIERRRSLRNIIRWSALFRLIIHKKNRQKVWWVLGMCSERLWSIYSGEKLSGLEPVNQTWAKPFRD